MTPDRSQTDDSPDLAFAALDEFPPPAGLSPMDRYQDFRAVFLGSEQGRRVLAQILSWGSVERPFAAGVPVDSHFLAILEGKRALAVSIFKTATKEPKAMPNHANRSEGDI